MKSILPILLLVCAAGSVNAQEFYVKAGTGYAFPMPGEKIDQYGNILNGAVSYSGSTIFSENLKNASLTSGLQGAVGAGLRAGKNVAVELNAFVTIATAKNTEMLTGRTNSSGQAYDYIAERQANGAIILNPAIVLQTDAAKWNVYSRMGLLLPLRTHMTLMESYRFTQTGDIDTYSWDIRNYFSVGFNAATGVKVGIGKGATLWGEVNTMFLNIARKERDLNDLTVNGRDYPLSQVPVTKIYYSKNAVNNATNEQPARSQPFSDIGIHLGVLFIVSGNSKKS